MAFAGVAACSAAMVTGCGEATCTKVFAADCVSIDLGNAAKPFVAGQPLTIAACVGNKCQSIVRTTSDLKKSSVVTIVLGTGIHEGQPVDVRVKVTNVRGHVVYDNSAKVTPREYLPNGPGCEPTAWQADTIVLANGTIAQRN